MYLTVLMQNLKKIKIQLMKAQKIQPIRETMHENGTIVYLMPDGTKMVYTKEELKKMKETPSLIVDWTPLYTEILSPVLYSKDLKNPDK